MKELLYNTFKKAAAALILPVLLSSSAVQAKPINPDHYFYNDQCVSLEETTPNFSYVYEDQCIDGKDFTPNFTLDEIINLPDEIIDTPDESTNIPNETIDILDETTFILDETTFIPDETIDIPVIPDEITTILKKAEFVTGDIIAHTSNSRQSKIIRSVTDDIYTHIGIIVERDNIKYVIEAVEPVKYTTLERWIDRGIDKKYTVKRLPEDYHQYIPQIISEAERHLNKHYDTKFNPSDKRMYCSELVAKAIERGAGLEVGEWDNFANLVDLNNLNRIAKREIRKRWGEIPKEMKVITPESIMDSGILKEVYSNY